MKFCHIKNVMAFSLFAALGGCGAMPQHEITRIEKASTLLFLGGPAGAVVVVDGNEVTHLARERTIVPVANGTHVVVVRDNGHVIYERTVFIQDGTQKSIPLK